MLTNLQKFQLRYGNEMAIFAMLALIYFFPDIALGQGNSATGGDALSKISAAGTLLSIVDSMLFTYGARILAGLSILAAGWNLKEQRFSMAILCVLAAIMIGTVHLWVSNIFAISAGASIFK